MRVVEKNFVDDQCGAVVVAKVVQRLSLGCRDIRAGGIIGMDDDHSSRPRTSCLVERIEVDLPSVIVDQRIRNELDIGEIGEKFKERVTRLGDENLITRVTQQTEDIGVGFARAGGQDDPLGIEIEDAMCLAIVATNGTASFEQSARLRIV